MKSRTAVERVFLLQILASLVLLPVAWTCVSCSRSEAVVTASPAVTMQAIREYGRGHQKTPPVFSNSSASKTTVSDLEGAEVYVVRMSQLLESGAYGQLDSEAQRIRVGRDRLAGGGWKLNTFYAAVSAPSDRSDGKGDWQAHITELKKWVAKDPQSAAARRLFHQERRERRKYRAVRRFG